MHYILHSSQHVRYSYTSFHDQYNDPPDNSMSTDWVVEVGSSNGRVRKGSTLASDPSQMRAAYRYQLGPGSIDPMTGFRIVRSLNPQN